MELQSLSQELRHLPWSERAAIAETSIVERHLRRAHGLPWTQTAITTWPYTTRERFTAPWHFWWQAHLIDCLIDAAERAETPERLRRVRRAARTHYYINGAWWRFNLYYDDLAWIGLAIQRGRTLGYLSGYQRPLRWLRKHLAQAENPNYALPWRKGEAFWNTPANGPAAIFFARTSTPQGVATAQRLCEWMHDRLLITQGPRAGLYADGLRKDPDGTERRVDYTFTYCQGVVLGAELELARRTAGEEQLTHLRRIIHLVEACHKHLTDDNGILTAGGGGDGGLFKGILIRYLAELAIQLPQCAQGLDEEDVLQQVERASRTAVDIVMRNAQAVWSSARVCNGASGVIFSAQWNRPAAAPLTAQQKREARRARADIDGEKIDGAVRSAAIAEQDLSTQLSGWMAVEAAARLERHGLSAEI